MIKIGNVKKYEEKIDVIKMLKEIQEQSGTYDYNEYMFGFANGLILALAIMENKYPQFLEKPEKYIGDKRNES